VGIVVLSIVTVGQIKSNSLRVKLFTILKDIGYTLPPIISPLAYLSKHATIGEGTIIMHHALVNANAKVGKNCIINTKALIEHEENSFVGSNATSKEYIEIDGFIKAGSVAK